MLAHLDAYHPLSYARAGTISTSAFSLLSGPLVYDPEGESTPIPAEQEPMLRKLGVPTRMEKGRVMLDEPFEVCKEGEILGSGQTTLLKMFRVTMAEFRVSVKACWTKETGEVRVVRVAKDGVDSETIPNENGSKARMEVMEMGMEEKDEGFEGFEAEG